MTETRHPRGLCLIAVSAIALTVSAFACEAAVVRNTASDVQPTKRAVLASRSRPQPEKSPEAASKMASLAIAAMLLLSAGLATRRRLARRREVLA